MDEAQRDARYRKAVMCPHHVHSLAVLLVCHRSHRLLTRQHIRLTCPPSQWGQRQGGRYPMQSEVPASCACCSRLPARGCWRSRTHGAAMHRWAPHPAHHWLCGGLGLAGLAEKSQEEEGGGKKGGGKTVAEALTPTAIRYTHQPSPYARTALISHTHTTFPHKSPYNFSFSSHLRLLSRRSLHMLDKQVDTKLIPLAWVCVFDISFSLTWRKINCSFPWQKQTSQPNVDELYEVTSNDRNIIFIAIESESVSFVWRSAVTSRETYGLLLVVATALLRVTAGGWAPFVRRTFLSGYCRWNFRIISMIWEE